MKETRWVIMFRPDGLNAKVTTERFDDAESARLRFEELRAQGMAVGLLPPAGETAALTGRQLPI